MLNRNGLLPIISLGWFLFHLVWSDETEAGYEGDRDDGDESQHGKRRLELVHLGRQYGDGSGNDVANTDGGRALFEREYVVITIAGRVAREHGGTESKLGDHREHWHQLLNR